MRLAFRWDELAKMKVMGAAASTCDLGSCPGGNSPLVAQAGRVRSTGDNASPRGALEDLVEKVASGQAWGIHAVSGKAWGIQEVTDIVASRKHYDVALSCSQQTLRGGLRAGQDYRQFFYEGSARSAKQEELEPGFIQHTPCPA